MPLFPHHFIHVFHMCVRCSHKQIISWKRNIVSKNYVYIIGRDLFIRWEGMRSVLFAQVNKEIGGETGLYIVCWRIVHIFIVVCQFATHVRLRVRSQFPCTRVTSVYDFSLQVRELRAIFKFKHKCFFLSFLYYGTACPRSLFWRQRRRWNAGDSNRQVHFIYPLQ